MPRAAPIHTSKDNRPHRWRKQLFDPVTGRPVKLTEQMILRWADAHVKRFQRWPQALSPGPRDAPPQWTVTWRRIDDALQRGACGLRGGKTLARLLEKRKPFWFYLARPTRAQLARMIRRHHALTGKWPGKESGRVGGEPGRNWSSINAMMVRDSRLAGSKRTLADLVASIRGRHNPRNLRPLTIEQVLKWADEFHDHIGRWPQKKKDLTIVSARGESWPAIDLHLRRGTRGLPPIGGLADLLDRHRHVRNKAAAPPITSKQILAWADEHYERTGRWPSANSGPVCDVPNENWMSLNNALKYGRRRLRTRTTLPRLLAKARGHRHHKALPRLSIHKVLRWAHLHYQRTGDWPAQTQEVIDQPGEKWSSIDRAMRAGRRGLPTGTTLHKLLLRKRKRYGQLRGIPLRRSQVLEWVAEHHELTGRLPTIKSGNVHGQLGETWTAIDASLRAGSRSMPGKSSLAELLAKHYAPAHKDVGRRLTTSEIWRWARSFHDRVGYWPTSDSAFVDQSRRERWTVLDTALRKGLRGLPGGSSLAKLLAQHGVKPDSTRGRRVT